MKHRATENIFWMAWLAILGGALLPVLLATLPPFVGPEARAVVMNAFAPLCHQMPSRSPHVMGVQLAVGHRTYGLLMGLPLGVLSFLVLARWEKFLDRHLPRVLAVASLPMAIDWFLGWFGIWANTPLSRLLTGALFGIAAGYYVTQGLMSSRTASRSAPIREEPPVQEASSRELSSK